MQVARARIKIVELEGPLFFGNAERLAAEVERSIEAADVVILDLRLVTSIDTTAALLIERLARRVSAGGSELVLAGVTPNGRHGRAFIAHSAFVDPVRRRWFHDADRAMEWAERRSLQRCEPTRVAELPVTALPLVKELMPEQQAIVAGLLQRIEARRARFIFHENDPGDAVYLIARGAVEIALMNPEGHRTRIATIEAGSLFGEMSLLDGGARSATAVATEPTVLYRLSRSTLLDELPVTHPLIARALLAALMSHVSQRLRETTRLVRQMDDARR
jgi:CRP-like cAMP-binding protein/ABC-type transporter Mla MlaB component